MTDAFSTGLPLVAFTTVTVTLQVGGGGLYYCPRLMARFTHRTPRPAPLVCAVAPLLLLASAALAQAVPSPATDAAALVRRAVANHMAAEAAHHPQRFVLHKKDDRHDYTQEVIETRQGDIALAIAAN